MATGFLLTLLQRLGHLTLLSRPFVFIPHESLILKSESVIYTIPLRNSNWGVTLRRHTVM